MNEFLRLLGHQDWIRYGVRDRILRHFRNPDTVNPSDFEVEFFGVKYAGNLACYLDWVVYFYGAYEKQELFVLRDLMEDSDRPVFIDVGANVGQHSLFMSGYCEQVHAFEPYEPVRRSLADKIRRNDLRNIFVHDIGLGERDGEYDFFVPNGPNSGTGSFVSSHETDASERKKLSIANGDTYLAGLHLERIDLIKIDVEGFEKSVLTGLKDTLDRHRPGVVMEFSDETKRSFSGEDELRSLFPEGYEIRRIESSRPFCGVFNRPGYRLVDFEFDVPEANLLATAR